MKLISMKKIKNKDKKQGYSRFRIIAGLLCLCVGVLTISVSFSNAWRVAYDDSSISKLYPFENLDDDDEIEEGLAEALSDEDNWRLLEKRPARLK